MSPNVAAPQHAPLHPVLVVLAVLGASGALVPAAQGQSRQTALARISPPLAPGP
jgi:hypothetical protein